MTIFMPKQPKCLVTFWAFFKHHFQLKPGHTAGVSQFVKSITYYVGGAREVGRSWQLSTQSRRTKKRCSYVLDVQMSSTFKCPQRSDVLDVLTLLTFNCYQRSNVINVQTLSTFHLPQILYILTFRSPQCSQVCPRRSDVLGVNTSSTSSMFM